MVRYKNEIRGFTIEDSEFVVSQYADDAALIVNVSPYSFDASIRILHKYEDMAALNTNVNETKVAIKNRQSRETGNIRLYTRRRKKKNKAKIKTQHNTICVGHHYAQIKHK